jgi:hypothetical protein
MSLSGRIDRNITRAIETVFLIPPNLADIKNTMRNAKEI